MAGLLEFVDTKLLDLLEDTLANKALYVIGSLLDQLFGKEACVLLEDILQCLVNRLYSVFLVVNFGELALQLLKNVGLVKNRLEELHANESERVAEKAQFALTEIQNLFQERRHVALILRVHVNEVRGKDFAEPLECLHLGLLSLAP